MLSEGWEYGMPFQRPYSSKSSGEAWPRTPQADRAFGAPDCPHPPPPPNKSNLATAPDSTEDWFSFQIKTVKHLGCFLVGGRPFLT